jgi:hypothetical protein
MHIQKYPSLVEMARKAPLDDTYAPKFRKAAIGAFDNAIDTFFQQDREVAEGRQAYDDLTDVQLALKTVMKRANKETRANWSAAIALAEKTPVPETVSIEIGPSEWDRDFPESSRNVKKITTYEKVETGKVDSPELSRIKKLADRMNQLLPIYASAAMVPGPMSVSVKNQLQELISFESSSSSSSSTVTKQEGFSLLPLRQTSKKTVSHSGSRSHTESSYSKTPIDERVVPELHSLREAFGRLDLTAAEETNIYARGTVNQEGEVPVKRSLGFFKGYETVWEPRREWSGRETVVLDTHVVNPSHLELYSQASDPQTPLAKLASEQPLGADLADTLRSKGGAVLGNALEVMFNPDREVKDGREAYDGLSDLGAALKVVHARQEVALDSNRELRDYDRRTQKKQFASLAELAGALDQVSPLYACVAMVPGEMSSTVKNFAKEIAEIRSSGGSGSSSRTEERAVSLLPPGYHSKTSHSYSRSSFRSQQSYESMTTDERIMNSLHDVRTQLFSLEGEDGKLYLAQEG